MNLPKCRSIAKSYYLISLSFHLCTKDGSCLHQSTSNEPQFSIIWQMGDIPCSELPLNVFHNLKSIYWREAFLLVC